MGRSILAVVAGYLTAVIGISTFFAFVMFVFLGGMPADPTHVKPPSWLLWAELGWSPIVAAFGGYVCAWVARRQEMRHAAALVALMLALGLVSVFTEAGLKPLWSSLAIAFVMPLAALAGARVRVAHVRDASA